MTNPDNDPALYADDPEHPLPYLQQLDAVAVRRAGGTDLFMFIAAPLQADERSQRRLLRKFDTYLGFIASPDFRREFGSPDPATTGIVVNLSPKSDPIVLELLKRCEPWVRQGKATLVVDTTPSPSQ